MKRKMVAAVTLAAVLLTGCSSVPDLTGAAQNMEAEYMAAALLKYDKNYQDGLDYDRSVLTATPTPSPMPKATPKASEEPAGSEVQGNGSATVSGSEAGSSSETEQRVSLEQLYGLDNVSIQAKSYAVKKSIGNKWAKITPREGKKLVAVYFNIKNTGSSRQKIDLNRVSWKYQLSLDGTVIGTSLMTILEEDMQFFQSTIAAGKSKQAVLVFEVEQDQKVDGAEVMISGDGALAGISITG